MGKWNYWKQILENSKIDWIGSKTKKEIIQNRIKNYLFKLN